ncbi:helix-turn-helix transcriptional regulator [Psychroserpens ponticola]|uniref:Tetratricopeptide repeat protein n=1 Tax=Psychroserpens ponticola TaxID=2932268 RepID=A0ABY7S1I4_9FLAO|nr:hypothetical protein [Psychroserpens ponticola]WCO03254.1 hypothetical protein MUN68_007080 [Psychroserpens ponticola]
MIFRYIILICLVFSLNSFAQTRSEKIETLKQELKQTENKVEQIKVLENLWKLTQYNDDLAAIDYAKQAINIAEKQNLPEELARAYERLGIAHSNISNYDASNKAYLKAIDIHKTLKNKRFISSLYMNQAINLKSQSKLDSALYYMDKSEPFIDERCCKDDSILMINLNSIKAQVLMEQGKYVLSLDKALKATELSKLVNDSIQYADNLALVGNNNQALGNNEVALDYLKESLIIYRIYEDTYFESQAAKDIAEVYAGKSPVEIDSAKFYFNSSVTLARDINTPYIEMQALNSFGEFLLNINEFERSKDIFSQSQIITNQLKDDFSQSRIDLALGKMYYSEKKYNQALTKTKEALKLKQQIGLLPGAIEANQYLSKIYKAKGDFKIALQYQEDYTTLADSLYNKEKAIKFDELQTKFDTEKKEAEIAFQNKEIEALNVKAENDKLTKMLYGIGMFSFLAISGLLYFGFKQRIKKNKIERDKQEEIYKQEIAFKKKELASQTLHLVQKSSFIQELKENLEKIKQSPELFKVEFRRLVMLLKKESAEDKDWEVFKSYFSEVHNNFDQKIKAISEDITEKEIRLASFLRMNLSTKEIATMLNVLPDSVLKSKYRLKKKLQLNKEDDLTQFLNTL